MSRTVPKSDDLSRLNALERRMAALERVPQTNGSTLWSSPGGLFTPASATPGAFAGTPSVQVQVGPSGVVICTVSAQIETAAASKIGGLVIQGAGPAGATSSGPGLEAFDAGGQIQLNMTAVGAIAGLIPGQWTFSMLLFGGGTGFAATIQGLYLQIDPK